MRYVLGQSAQGNQVDATTTNYFAVKNTWNGGGKTAETSVQLPSLVAGTFSNFNFRMSSNSQNSGNAVITSRKNTADANITVTIPFGTTGDYQDLSNSDTIAVNDTYDFSCVCNGTGGALTFYSTINFKASSYDVVQASCGTAATTTASTMFFIPVASICTTVSTETDAQIKIKNSVTVKNFQIRIVTNARVTDTVYSSRKNGANGNATITVATTLTGVFTDVSNSDSLADGDLYCFSFTTSTGGGTISCHLFQAQYQYSSQIYDSFDFSLASAGVARAASATKQYVQMFGGTHSSWAAESVRRQLVPSPITVTKFSCFVSANTYSVSATSTIRKNLADGKATLTLTNAVTGEFEDVTNSDSYVAGDIISISMVGGSTGSLTNTWWGIQVVDAVPKVNALIVAGGGGGGAGGVAGGGGAGGYQTLTDVSVSPGAFSVIVGAGGAGGGTGGIGTQGKNSVFLGTTAIGGGYGAATGTVNGGNGGSGGGGSSVGGPGTGGTGSQGNNGGAASATSGGGGGGAGAVGGAGGVNVGGNGGNGLANSISGSSVTYAGGGGGNAGVTPGSGGTGGGGGPSTSGTANTGGGGGAWDGTGTAGNGGSGIVIVSYVTGNVVATGGTITTSGDMTIHTFTSNGTFVVGKNFRALTGVGL